MYIGLDTLYEFQDNIEKYGCKKRREQNSVILHLSEALP